MFFQVNAIRFGTYLAIRTQQKQTNMITFENSFFSPHHLCFLQTLNIPVRKASRMSALTIGGGCVVITRRHRKIGRGFIHAAVTSN